MFLHPHLSNKYFVSTEVIQTMSNKGAIDLCLYGNSKLSQQISNEGIPILFISFIVSGYKTEESSQFINRSISSVSFITEINFSLASSVDG